MQSGLDPSGRIGVSRIGVRHPIRLWMHGDLGPHSLTTLGRRRFNLFCRLAQGGRPSDRVRRKHVRVRLLGVVKRDPLQQRFTGQDSFFVSKPALGKR
jgi:hypothetical protein